MLPRLYYPETKYKTTMSRSLSEFAFFQSLKPEMLHAFVWVISHSLCINRAKINVRYFSLNEKLHIDVL